jgi:hypothetical protein
MADFEKFEAFVEGLAHKKYDLGSDQIAVALVAEANAPDLANDAVLADLTEAAYTYCSSRNLTTVSSAQTSGVYKLVVADTTLTASGGPVGPFRYVVAFDDDATNDDLISMHDLGQDITLADGETYDLDYDQSGGLLTLA